MPARLLPVLLLATAASAADRVPLALNLSGVVDWSAEHPFADVFRYSRDWVPQQEGRPWGQGDPLELGDHGYPVRLKPGQFATTLVLLGRGAPAGRYVLTHDGRGKLRIKGGGRVVAEQPGRLTIEVSGPNVLIEIVETDPADPLRNVAMRRPDVGADDVFTPSLVDRVRRFEAVRFMDWQRTNDSPIVSWTDRAKPSDRTQATDAGVAVELMCDLANVAKVDAWFCIPHRADDDFVRQFAELVRERLDAGRAVYVEHSNEVWNGQFGQATYAAERGLAAGLSDNRYQAQLKYHAGRSAEIFAIWNAVLGENRVVCVLGSQSANPWVTEQLLSVPQAKRLADAVAIAPYFGNELGDPQTAADVARMSVGGVLDRCEELIDEGAVKVAAHRRLCEAAGLDLIAYEGGQHLVGHGGAENNEELRDLLIAANRHPRMASLYEKALDVWAKNGGGLYAVFSSVSEPSKWGSWGLLEYDGQPVDETPKWRAIADYLRE